jgi:hypothetical protein
LFLFPLCREVLCGMPYLRGYDPHYSMN